MPTVPKDDRVSQFPRVQPSETDLWMALATMKELGRFSDRLDPSLQGQIEDRTKMSPSERTSAEAESTLKFLGARSPEDAVVTQGGGIADQLGARDIGRKKTRASIGVSGGSR